MYGYIYITTNLINNKIYIGQHKSPTFDSKYFGSGKLLIEALNKYGVNNFSCKMLEECNSEEELNDREIFYISKYKSKVTHGNYNISDGGFVPRLSGELNPNFGKHRPHTEEEKLHLSEITKGHKPTFTRKRTEEEKKRLSEISSNYRHTEEVKEKIKNHHKNAQFLTNGVLQGWFYGDDIDKAKRVGYYKGICKKRAKKKVTEKTIAANKKNGDRLKDTKWVHKGSDKPIQVDKKLVHEYLSQGYSLGMKNK